ncbi:MAG TPA: hypothetical protein VMM18_17325 [Gemmatimonadaceae bacterium]|nr:hypothetical protein [Gemmatimonadaceae bacterium]
MPIVRLRRIVRGAAFGAVATALIAVAAGDARSQQPAGTQELGIDAGATIALGGRSSVVINLPAARARMGFFMQSDSRWSWEPALGLSYVKVEGADGVLFYGLELGALRHFRPGADLREQGVSVSYLRPFIGVDGYTGSAGDNEVSVGAGFGVKIPWRQDLAWRLEANTGYGFDNRAWRLGAFAGLSFFTDRAIR